MPADPTELLLGALMLLAGALVSLPPRRSYQGVGLAALALAAALTTARHLGPSPALAVAATGLAVAALARARPGGRDSLGLALRLLLVGFAATATLALALNRPLGSPAALDLNLTWYWTGAVGGLLLLGEREPESAGLGGALVAAAVGLVALHLGPPNLLLPLWALPPLTLAAAARWRAPT